MSSCVPGWRRDDENISVCGLAVENKLGGVRGTYACKAAICEKAVSQGNGERLEAIFFGSWPEGE